MALKYVGDYMKLILKLTAFLMFVFSTSSTKQCTPKKTERGGYVIRNIGIKLCKLKCAEIGQCLSIDYDIETLTCRLSRTESNIKKKEGHVIFARDHSHVPTSSCTSGVCSFGQRCLKTRSGKAVCVQDEKQNDPAESPQRRVDKKETFANSPLHEASRKGNLTRVRHIVFQCLVDINRRDNEHGRTPLMVAAQEGHCSTFEFLIRKGADKSSVDNDGKNVLHWACKGGHAGMVECVLSQYGFGKNKLVSPLKLAAWKGNVDVFEFLVCMGSDLSKVDRDGNNILHHASLGGSVAIVKYILTQGHVDINIRRKDGKNAVLMAALGGHKDVFNFLVSIGGNPSCEDGDGNNILHAASSAGRVQMVKHILSRKLVDINARNKYGKTAAMIAKHRGKLKVYNLLVSRSHQAK